MCIVSIERGQHFVQTRACGLRLTRHAGRIDSRCRAKTKVATPHQDAPHSIPPTHTRSTNESGQHHSQRWQRLGHRTLVNWTKTTHTSSFPLLEDRERAQLAVFVQANAQTSLLCSMVLVDCRGTRRTMSDGEGRVTISEAPGAVRAGGPSSSPVLRWPHQRTRWGKREVPGALCNGRS